MARSNELMKAVVRNTRYFSEDFKRKKVKELDKRITSIADICKEYEVSNTAVYKWVYKYSLMRKKGVKMVVEPESDTARIKALKQHISELEQLLGKSSLKLTLLKSKWKLPLRTMV